MLNSLGAFVLKIGFWIQNPFFTGFLMGKNKVWAYNPVAFGHINILLPTNPEQNMVEGGGVKCFSVQSNKELFRGSFLKEVDNSENSALS